MTTRALWNEEEDNITTAQKILSRKKCGDVRDTGVESRPEVDCNHVEYQPSQG